MEGQEALGNYALGNFALGNFDGDDFQQEISDGGPQIAIKREQILKDYIDSKKNPETVKKTKRENAALQK